MSFCFGDMPATGDFGAEGAGTGLRVQLLSQPARQLVVLYGADTLATVALDETLRAHAFEQVEVRYLESGLWVRYGTRMLLSGLRIDHWAPRHTWRFGFGSGTLDVGGDERAVRHDSHWIDNVEVYLGRLATPRGSVPVEVSLNGGQFSQSGLRYTYLPSASALSVDPTSGPHRGGTLVRIRGNHIQGGVHYLCAFNGTSVAAHLQPDGALTCITPPANGDSTLGISATDVGSGGVDGGSGVGGDVSPFAPRAVLAAITINGQDYTSDALAFVYHDTPRVDSIYPRSGSLRGGAMVTVSGTGLTSGSQPRCRFGVGGTVAGSVRGAGQMLCHTPATDFVLRSVPLEVSLNAQQYTTDHVPYAVYAHPSVASFSPDRGPIDGGTLVRIHGANFDGAPDLSVYHCRFGEAVTNATLVNRSLLTCITMPLIQGVHCLEVTQNGQDYTSACVQFTALQTTFLTALSPTSGPVEGDTLVTIQGVHVARGVDYRCRFVDGAAMIMMRATMLEDEGGVRCTSPIINGTTQLYSNATGGLARAVHELSVTINGQQYTPPVSFEVYEVPVTRVITPSTGPVLGSTLVSLLGSNYSGGSHYLCAFDSEVVDAFVVADASMNCTTPRTVSAAGIRTVRVSLNGQQYTTALPFRYYGDESISTRSISPSSGPSGGNTTVTVATGVGLSHGSDYRCSFGDGGVVSATHGADNRTIICHSPQLNASRGPQPFTVTRNGQQYAISTAEFTFLGAPRLVAPSPLSGPQEGGTLIALGGADLTNGSHYLCLCEGDRVDARIDVDRHAVMCTMPPSTRSCDAFGRCVGRLGDTACTVSLNGQQYTNAVEFLYHETPHASASSPACGPMRGGTSINVFGVGFRNGTDMYCHFGHERVRAHDASAGGAEALGCVLPGTWDGPAVVPLTVTLNGQQYSKEPLNFTVLPASELSDTLPLHGPALGTGLILHGANLTGGCDYQVSFTTATAENTTLPCRSNSVSGHVEVRSPRFEPIPESGTSLVRVSLNGQQYTNPIEYGVEAPVYVCAVSPTLGPTAGGTKLRITGANFRNTSLLRCKFGEHLLEPMYYSPSRIDCIAPRSSLVAPDAAPLFHLTDAELRSLDAECYTDSAGGDYIGHVRQTREGNTCQPWASQAPHTHGYSAQAYPRAGLGAHNECRNPGGSQPSPWCFTTSPDQRWGLCDVGAPQASCPKRFSLEGDASLTDGTLRLTSSEAQSGRAQVPVERLLPAELAGQAPLGGFRVEFDYLYVPSHQSVPAGQYKLLRGQSKFSISYGLGGSVGDSTSGVEVRVTFRDNTGLYAASPRVQVHVNGDLVHVTYLRDVMFRSHAFVPIVLALTADAQLHLRFHDAIIIDNLALLELQPASSWQLGLSARTGSAQYDIHAVDNLRIRQLRGDRPARVAVDATLNQQDYALSVAAYEYAPSAHVSSCSPTTGPAAGGTLVRLYGSALGGGVDLRCRFGDEEVRASYAPGPSLICHTPAAMEALPGAVLLPLHATVNGQDYVGPSLSFVPYAAPRVDRLSVPFGPIYGNTTLIVHGANLDVGDDRRCRFGDVVHTVPATLVTHPSGPPTVRCVSPAQHLAGGVAVEISPNAQDYTNDTVAFSYYDAPALRTLSPNSGPSHGSTSILITGLALANHTDHFACKFGRQRVAATVLSHGTSVRCYAPTAVAAGAETTLVFNFGTHASSNELTHARDGEQGEYTLVGHASILSDGSLALTPNDYHQAGSISIQPPRLVANVARSFDATFGAYIGDGSGGQGMCFCYGELPAGALTAAGVDSGLCVRFLTRDLLGAPAQALHVVLDGAVLRDIDLRELAGTTEWPLSTYIVERSADFLRVRATMPVHIAYSATGLRVTYGEHTLVDGLKLPYWTPSETWQFAIGASTSQYRDSHQLSHLRLQLGAFVETSGVDVEITANGQQFSVGGPPFTFYPPPVVSWVLPAAGPRHGGTLVVLAGAGLFHNVGQLRCKFNETIVHAEFVSTRTPYARSLPLGASLSSGGGVLCRTPLRDAPTNEPVYLSLNAQQYTPTSSMFELYESPRVIQLDPPTGPALGGTHVTVHGANLMAGSNSTRYCTFGVYHAIARTPVRASVHSAASVLCISPPLPLKGSPTRAAEASSLSAPVELSLNDLQNLTDDGVNFTYFPPTVVSSLSPTTGPSSGDTLLTILGDFSPLGSQLNCSFGVSGDGGGGGSGGGNTTVIVPATRRAHDTMLCYTRPLPPGSYTLSLSLNGQVRATSMSPHTSPRLPISLHLTPPLLPCPHLSYARLPCLHRPGLRGPRHVHLLLPATRLRSPPPIGPHCRRHHHHPLRLGPRRRIAPTVHPPAPAARR